LLDDPAADVALAAAGATGEESRAIEDDSRPRTGQILATRLVVGKLADHVQQEEQGAIVDAWQFAGVATEIGPTVDFLFLGLPVHAKRRVGQQIIEPVHVVKAILGQRISADGACVAGAAWRRLYNRRFSSGARSEPRQKFFSNRELAGLLRNLARGFDAVWGDRPSFEPSQGRRYRVPLRTPSWHSLPSFTSCSTARRTRERGISTPTR